MQNILGGIKMRVYGYARVSTKKELEKQNLDRQHFILKEYA